MKLKLKKNVLRQIDEWTTIWIFKQYSCLMVQGKEREWNWKVKRNTEELQTYWYERSY